MQRSRAPRPVEPAPIEIDEPAEEPKAVVRTKRFDMRPMSVDEAILQMEMLGHDFFFFLDANTGTHSVLYHRDDGALGLIEPA